jgi:RHS repeat-associated protein
MPNRHSSQSDYRYGYQGSEKDNEVKGNGNSYTTFYRGLDPRLGRWLSIDPEASAQPFLSPYQSMGNNPISRNDPLGNVDDQVVDADGNVIYDDGQNNGVIYRFNGTCDQECNGTFESWQSEGLLDQLTKPVQNGAVKWVSKNESSSDFVNQRLSLYNFQNTTGSISFTIGDQNALVSKVDSKVHNSQDPYGHSWETGTVDILPASERSLTYRRDSKSNRRNLLYGLRSIYDLDNALAHEKGHFDLVNSLTGSAGGTINVIDFGLPHKSLWTAYSELFAASVQTQHDTWASTSNFFKISIYSYLHENRSILPQVIKLSNSPTISIDFIKNSINKNGPYNWSHYNFLIFEPLTNQLQGAFPAKSGYLENLNKTYIREH